MARELKYNIDVLVNAEFQPNAQEFFTKAYLGSDIVGNFRVLPNIKHSTKLAFTLFASVLKESTCEFESSATTLGSVDISVKALSAMIELCQFEIETSFLVTQMATGSNNFSIPTFLTYFWGEAALEISEEIELIRWQGVEDGTGFTEEEDFLALVNGYEFLLDNAKTGTTAAISDGTAVTPAVLDVVVGRKGQILAVNVVSGGAYSVAPTAITLSNTGNGKGATFTVQTTGTTPTISVTGVTVVTSGTAYNNELVFITGTTITQANVLTEMAKVFNAQPRRIRRRKDLLRWYVPPSVADFYRQATAVGNTITYITKALDLTYLDIKLIVCDGMSDNTMVLTRWDNLGYAFDAEGDASQLTLVDLMKATAEPKLRARTNLKVGFFILNREEIVSYKG